MNYIRSLLCIFVHLSIQLIHGSSSLIHELPNQTLIDGIKQAIHASQIYKENGDSLFIKSNAHYAYLAGEYDDSQLNEIINELAPYQKISLICQEKYHTFFLEHGYSLQPRIEFEFTGAGKKIRRECPAGFTVVPIKTLELFKKCLWFEFISKLYGSSENFLNTGFGFALVDDQGNPIAEAYAALLSNQACEIGVITHLEHRSKGFSTLVVHHMICECLKRGLQPHWSCNAENVASRSVAHKSGFTIKRYYAFLNRN
ncbi:MAG: GNAT acetyltransferase [Candidatus Dependentiae bacterium ADurb.Bin331]|nr:MAG: GNAT acetyltransferase [Candidatus Dependentiae bacterium ADurb.Bin331]